MDPRRQSSNALRTSALLAVLLAGCESPEAALERQIAGESCAFEAVYEHEPNTVRSLDEENHQCVRREVSLGSWLFPPLVARCQEDAARCAARAKDKTLVPALVNALYEEVDEHDTGDGKIFVRAAFASSLGIIGDERAIEPLIEVLVTAKPTARKEAAKALGRFGEKARAAGPDLDRAFRAPNPKRETELEALREAAAEALARTNPEQAALTLSSPLDAPFHDLDATELALSGMTRSKAPLPLDEKLLALARELPERMCKGKASSDECWALYRICNLTESELRRRGASAHHTLDCRAMR